MNATRRVLVVDDEDEFREVVVEHLRTQGFEVAEASNGLEALLRVKRLRPAFVVLDLMMPRLGGVGVLKRIRAFDPSIRVVVVTGIQDEELHRQARALGAAFILMKPVAPPDLLAALGVADPAPAEPAAPPAGPPPSPAPPGASSGRVLVVDDDPGLRTLLDEFLTLDGYRVRSVADAAAALRAIVEEVPDVVLLDIGMPGLSGVDALPAVRALAPDVKVIMVSGESSAELAQRALAYGAFDYVTKPPDLAYLKQSLETALMMRQLEAP